MLAEPRRKQKWSIDPRNTTWTKDESRYGVKMLEKMGWKKGKGLGADEAGSTDIVKVSVKNGTRGVGFTHVHENNWVAHQDSFSELLANLNQNQNETETPTTEISSLAEKSKLQKRIHYKKFANGKDVSNYKSADMAAIFGQTASQAPNKTQQIEKKEEPTEAKFTTTSQYSVQEYFKMKMSAIQNNSDEKSTEEPLNDVELPKETEILPKKSKKKKSKSKETDKISSKKRKKKDKKSRNKKAKISSVAEDCASDDNQR
ncbi:PIN2/TERF1-interacting telomerase inhibitor 1-like [Ciona intestinalis]